MKLSFKKRIALYNLTAIASLTAIAFVAIYAVVYYTSYQHLDNDIATEKEEVFNNLDWKGNDILMNKMPEWEEAEHKQLEVNPTFLQIVDLNEHTIFKSANLQENHFLFNPNIEKTTFYNSIINKQRIRQGQFPIFNENNKIIGHLTIGVSQQESFNVLHNLLLVLCLTYVIMLGTLYAIISFVASKAIAPVNELIHIASKINETNINSRLPLPENEDEIHKLATTINELLNRLDYSIHQQKQFTADASHEMHTPLTAIKGTIEVLLRRKRTPEQYESKMKEVLVQTDRLSHLFDQLLQLARLESNIILAKKENIVLKDIVEKIINTHHTSINNNNNKVQVSIPQNCIVKADAGLLERILNNLIINAIKYNHPNGNIFCEWNDKSKSLTIKDEGIGISKKQLPYLFNRFFRADNSRSSHISGNGLGLSIVKRLCDLQNIKITIESIENKGSSFIITFTS
ncbi:MAG: HAMP domain-containing sensor histidine kinase [Flavobacterium sp.]|uniref:sensor histidine kinase n=1 Tax=Flavobacterium sp. TaxID=239 RepID=UPI00260EBFFB|nr:HAMP domain-containing sensor histidine kinase [Flavobacterium sp.]MDD5150030.1 HAMP domain-containing sensor histidine kinase [Flavobacterium sp.]